MKIGIDLKNLYLYGKGIGNFLISLLDDLSEIHFDKLDFLLLAPKIKNEIKDISFDSFHIDIVAEIDKSSKISKVLYDQIFVLKALNKNSVDLLFSPYFDIPFFWNRKLITTIHDLSIIHLKSQYNFFFYQYYNLLLKKAIRQSSFIYTVSESSKKEIIKEYKYPEENIFVLYNRVSDNLISFQAIDENEKARFRNEITLIYNLPKDFILYTGGIENRKNIPLLIDGLNLARKECLEVPKLVITGYDPITHKQYDRWLQTNPNVILLPLVDKNVIPVLYDLCSCVVNTSSYEGFGIPILEGLTLGKPIICSDIPVYREIADGIAIFFDNNSTVNFIEKLEAFFKKEISFDKELAIVKARFFNDKTLNHQNIINSFNLL